MEQQSQSIMLEINIHITKTQAIRIQLIIHKIILKGNTKIQNSIMCRNKIIGPI
jgi:phosphoenolpyruvate carboxylase